MDHVTAATTDHPATTDHHPAEPSDAALLQAYRAYGDRHALAGLYERHAAAAFAVAYRVCGRTVEAEDAVQDGMLAVMACAGQYRTQPGVPVRSWILALVANAARQRGRENRRRQQREREHGRDIMGLPDAPAPDHAGADAGMAEDVRTILDRLPEHERTPVLLRHADQLSIAEIASALGRKEKTVRSQIERGLAHVRDGLVRRGRTVAPAVIPLAMGLERAQPSAALLERLTHQAREAAAPLVAAGAGAPFLAWVIGVGLVAALGLGVAADRLAAARKTVNQPVAPVTAVPPVAPEAPGFAPEPSAAAEKPGADRLLGRAFDGAGNATDGQPDAYRARGAAIADVRAGISADWATGIKAVDLFAPLAKGGHIALYGPAGVGRVVLIEELAERERRGGGRTVLVGWDQEPGSGHAFFDDLDKATVNLPPAAVMVWQEGTQDHTGAEQMQAADNAAAMAAEFHAAGHDVLVVACPGDGRTPNVLARLAALAGTAADGTAITVLICHPLGDIAAAPLAADEDARIVMTKGAEFDGTYPLIDPAGSQSRQVDADGTVAALRTAARSALMDFRHRAEQIGARAAADDPNEVRAARLHAYLAQPFYTTVAFTGRPGETVTPAECLATVAKILHGDAEEQLPMEQRHVGGAPK